MPASLPASIRLSHLSHLSRVIRPTLLAALLVPLAGCGLGDAGSSAATAAKLKAHEAEQAQATRARIETQLDAANQQAEQRRKEAEAANR
ncbi:hypothetical protein [Zoogloea dura]|uniref:Uncharacterized protein n=1 Tax=Zoogloea dura TaxID=2728840 RepID=A0A848G461_9RHOO|nr:hypothetical protein [Zoogloea dura]NML25223.1 hypothetical protein [Zoogloea dura]